jgi:hypothetical protein
MVRVYDPLLSFDKLKRQLQESASSGSMDENLRRYAAGFGITNLANGTFADVRISDAGAGTGGGDPSGLQGPAIAGVVVGVFLALVLGSVMVWFLMTLLRSKATPAHCGEGSNETPRAAGSV